MPLRLNIQKILYIGVLQNISCLMPAGFQISPNAQKITLWKAYIIRLSKDAIVNAANVNLCGVGGIDGAIHKAAGPGPVEELSLIGQCPTGCVVVSGLHRLESIGIIHTVGPRDQDPEMLQACYVLHALHDKGFHTIAFPCIGTSVQVSQR